MVLLRWRQGDDGWWPTAAVLDTRTWRWRRAPEAPAQGFNIQAGMHAVWTGREVLVAGGANLALDPVRLRWRVIDTGLPAPGILAWTGREAVGWGGGCCGDAFDSGAAYDPARRTTRALPPAPLRPKQEVVGAWTGRELLILGGGDADGNGFFDAAAYDPAGNSWRRITSMPLEDRSPARWDGRQVLMGSLELAYDPATDRWRRLDSAVHPRGRMTWAGGRVVFGGWSGAAVPRFLVADPASGTVRRLPAPPVAGHDIALWTGRGLLVWGTDRRLGGRVENGALFTPRASWGPAS